MNSFNAIETKDKIVTWISVWFQKTATIAKLLLEYPEAKILASLQLFVWQHSEKKEFWAF